MMKKNDSYEDADIYMYDDINDADDDNDDDSIQYYGRLISFLSPHHLFLSLSTPLYFLPFIPLSISLSPSLSLSLSLSAGKSCVWYQECNLSSFTILFLLLFLAPVFLLIDLTLLFYHALISFVCLKPNVSPLDFLWSFSFLSYCSSFSLSFSFPLCFPSHPIPRPK